jgi:pSer/pThr/pTyr-binding forkhead associated (FHA) protein
VPGQQFALRFISGKYQGGEFPLRVEHETVIGRSSDLDMVLVEDMVSRKHAMISTVGGELTIEDMGSTNGTFVNGEKITRARLKEGDRILIGTSIIKLVTIDNTAGPLLVAERGEMRMMTEDTGHNRRMPANPARPMSGSIAEIPLPDLLQLMTTSRKDGVLHVTCDSPPQDGRLFFRKGQVYYATIDDRMELTPKKAVFRMLRWTTGTFELEPPDDKQFMNELTESTEALLLDSLRQVDELTQLSVMPGREELVSVVNPLAVPLRQLTAVELDIFQLVLNHGGVGEVLDRSELSDLETYQTLQSLVEREYVVLVS